ncbi:MAG: hypothetical protein ABR517_12825 [Thermoanaerobaculia bacterium]
MLERLLVLALLFPIAAAASEPLEGPMRDVERVRGLAFEAPVEVVTVPRADLRKTLEAQIAKSSTLPVGEYLSILNALGLIRREEADLERLMELYEAQVLAFYDPDTHKYYTFDQAPGEAAMDETMVEAVAVHELTHALQDQKFNAGARLRALEPEWDAQLAYHSVLEGEATFVMLAALLGRMGVTLEQITATDDIVAGIAAMGALNPGFPADAPPYFVESLKFPYLRGLELVVAMYRQDGWAGVDRLHANPPRSSEEVMNPELYLARTGAAPAACAARKATLATTLGAFHWTFLLGEEAGSGWASDCVRVTRRGSTFQIEGTSGWDSEADAVQFAEELRRFLAGRNVKKPKVDRKGIDVSFRWVSVAP